MRVLTEHLLETKPPTAGVQLNRIPVSRRCSRKPATSCGDKHVTSPSSTDRSRQWWRPTQHPRVIGTSSERARAAFRRQLTSGCGARAAKRRCCASACCSAADHARQHTEATELGRVWHALQSGQQRKEAYDERSHVATAQADHCTRAPAPKVRKPSHLQVASSALLCQTESDSELARNSQRRQYLKIMQDSVARSHMRAIAGRRSTHRQQGRR